MNTDGHRSENAFREFSLACEPVFVQVVLHLCPSVFIWGSWFCYAGFRCATIFWTRDRRQEFPGGRQGGVEFLVPLPGHFHQQSAAKRRAQEGWHRSRARRVA